MLGGGLFSRYFLNSGIRTLPSWQAITPAEIAGFAAAARAAVESFRKADTPNEAVTEERLIFPTLRLLGWDLLPQQAVTRRREDIPDALLFADADAVAQAMREPPGPARYKLATVVHESKRWELPLDRATDANGRTPASQALRYLRLAEELSGGGIRWAVLSNGRLWRLYAYDVTSQAERYLEADLEGLLAPGGETALRGFLLLFRQGSFVAGPDGRSVLEAAVDEATEWQQAVTTKLSRAVFQEVFPELLRAISRGDTQAAPEDPGWPDTVRNAALVLLYRLLFLLYAEDRDLLPVTHDGYRPFAITTLRREVADAITRGRTPSEKAATWWPRLLRLFSSIAGGSDDMGLPPYNGGLFDGARTLLLTRITIPDAAFAKVLNRLSSVSSNGQQVWINYRDLSVQQLGAIYEGLLERGVLVDADVVVPVKDETLRHGSGAYYTPEALVRLVMRQAVAPVLADRRARFAEAAERLNPKGREKAGVMSALAELDPATSFLGLKICDPAMGSGHFLVSLVDWLSDETLSAMEEATDVAEAVAYRSPLADRIEREREQIEAAAGLHGWPLDPRHLDDRQMVRRLVLKRVIYGVDLNPLAVELAKLSLWLHSFTVGAPLSYLDHHLRCGNSLFGAWVADADKLTAGAGRAKRGGLALAAPIAAARSAAQAMAQIEDLSDADIAQVKQSAGLFGDIETATRPLRGFLDCLHALLWLPKPVGSAGRKEREGILNAWLDGSCGDPVSLANGVPPRRGTLAVREAIDGLLRSLRAIARERRLLHWQPAFPGIWRTWQEAEPEGGFDAIIGNPPYVRQEQLAPFKGVLKQRYTAYDGMADLYVYFFEQALRLLRPGGRFAFTVTNKWLKAGYAEDLRGVLADRAWLEAVTDFGHAKGFFPGTDVFPSLICARRPTNSESPPQNVTVAVVPRDLVRMDDLEVQVSAGSFSITRSELSREPWILEPADVRALMARLARLGAPLREVAGSPLYGIKTGFNEAFVVDARDRAALVEDDANCATLMRPFLRGQDIDRWASEWAGRSLILLASSNESNPWPWSHLSDEEAEECFSQVYPSVYRRFVPFKDKLIAREDQGRFWWELRSCAYYEVFVQPKIIYQVIQYTPSYSLDGDGLFLNDKGFMLSSEDPWLLGVLNSPLFWWFGWRYFARMKDEALTPQGYRVEELPIATPDGLALETAATSVAALHAIHQEQHAVRHTLRNWLRITWGVEKPPTSLLNPFAMTADQFATAVRAALPRAERNLSAAAIGALRNEHVATVMPMAARLAEAAQYELMLSRQVDRIYGVDANDEKLIWATAPPRMPVPAPDVP